MNDQKLKPLATLVSLIIIIVIIVFLCPSKKEDTKPKKTAIPTIAAGIPGLTPSDIKTNLEKRSFDCSNVKVNEDKALGEWYSWTCKRDMGILLMDVYFSSRSLSSVDAISASIVQYVSPSDDAAGSFLGYVATFAFIGNDAAQSRARQWVESNLPRIQDGCVSETINKIKFELCGKPAARTLKIGMY